MRHIVPDTRGWAIRYKSSATTSRLCFPWTSKPLRGESAAEAPHPDGAPLPLPVKRRSKRSAPRRPERIRAFASILFGVLLLQTAWAVAIPMFRGPDEIEHVKRASSIALGQFLPDSGEGPSPVETITVERDIVAAQREICDQLHSEFDPTICVPVETRDADTQVTQTTADMRSAAARYNPAWYVMVAPASWFLEGAAAVKGMRVLGALACALVLSWSIWLYRRVGMHRGTDTGLMFCATPAVTFASALAAPNGLHLAGSLLLWVALLRLTPGPRRTWAMCAGAAIMSLTHTLGIFWIVCAIVIVAVLRGRMYLRMIGLGLLQTRGAFALLVASQMFAVVWILVARTNDPTAGGDVLAESTKSIPAFGHVVVWALQVVGTMPFRFGLLWPVVYALWVFAFASFLWLSIRDARTRERSAMATVVVLAVAIPATVTMLTYRDHGYAWQGRYELPLLFALPLIAGSVFERAGAGRAWLPNAWTFIAGLSVGAATLCLALREGATGPAAIACVVLSALGWWATWRQPGRQRRSQDQASRVYHDSTTQASNVL